MAQLDYWKQRVPSIKQFKLLRNQCLTRYKRADIYIFTFLSIGKFIILYDRLGLIRQKHRNVLPTGETMIQAEKLELLVCQIPI